MTDANQYESLLAAVIAAPSDHAPRLVLADWLEEQGTAESSDRAAFIRGQIEMEGLNTWDPRWAELKIETGDLLDRHLQTWAGPAAKWDPRNWIDAGRHGMMISPIFDKSDSWTFQGGFPDVAHLRVDDFVQIADRMASSTPVRQLSLILMQTQEQLARIQRRIPILREQGSASWMIHADEQLLERALASPDVIEVSKFELIESLESLSLSDLGDQDVADVMACDRLGHLRELKLELMESATRASGFAIAESDWKELRRLELRTEITDDEEREECQLGDDGVKALADSKSGQQLERIALERVNCDDGGLAAISGIGGLRELELRGNPITDAGIAAISKGACREQLEALSVLECQITPRSINSLSMLDGLQRLELSFKNVLSVDLNSLARLQNLESLKLVSPDSLLSYMRAPEFAKLRALDVCLGDDGSGAQYLANSPKLSGLTSLTIRCDHEVDEVLTHLANSKHLRQLRSLRLVSLNLGVLPGLVDFAQATQFERLVYLELPGALFLSAEFAEDILDSPVFSRLHMFHCVLHEEATAIMKDHFGSRYANTFVYDYLE